MYLEFYKNLLTVTGGKLTTFRVEAKKTLLCLKKFFPIKIFDLPFSNITIKELEEKFSFKQSELLRIQDIERLLGFYGKDVEIVLERILKNPKVFTKVFIYHPENCLYEEELLYSMNNEWVQNWEDLAYRRFRIGFFEKNLIPIVERLYKNTRR